MTKHLLSLLLLFLFAFTLIGYGQETAPLEKKQITGYNGLYAGGQASTNGLGFSFRYILSPRLSFSAGMESINLVRNFQIHGYGVPFNAEVNYKTGGLFLLGELFYTRSLYVAAGLISNNFQPRAEGTAMTSIRYGDVVLQPSAIGTLSIEAEPEYKRSPYAGLGIRRFLDKNRIVSCNFETGFYYLGAPNMHLEATGLLQPTADPANGKEEYLEAQFSHYKYFPVVKAGLAVRLF